MAGVRGFSLAEASRRLGVSVAAPYRHFADRDELLVAVAVRSLKVFAAMVAAETGDSQDPPQRLASMTRAYVRFAAEQRPLPLTELGKHPDWHVRVDQGRFLLTFDRGGEFPIQIKFSAAVGQGYLLARPLPADDVARQFAGAARSERSVA